MCVLSVSNGIKMCVLSLFKNMRPEVFFKKGVPKNFAKFTETPVSLFFNKVVDLRPANLLKRDSDMSVFM